MAQSGADRVVWTDFDRAQTLSPFGLLPEYQHEWMAMDQCMAVELAEDLVEDMKAEGGLKKAWRYYYHYS